jgi:hypothetical protein
LQTKTKYCHRADFKSVKQEVNGTVILPPLVLPALPIPLRALFQQLLRLLLVLSNKIKLGRFKPQAYLTKPFFLRQPSSAENSTPSPFMSRSPAANLASASNQVPRFAEPVSRPVSRPPRGKHFMANFFDAIMKPIKYQI